ncbi:MULTISPECIES: hypothetical protein [Spirosoma]|uniref:Uncharacterized protein n=1 Tax=Spirosoma sordidisoli TaxID=2502893 RepID=A0A4Q2UK09_9BACT|nr:MULTISPECIES: hypothetical protein [Spirosoma]RYC68972.1 hypothetical protein EQG79_16350 [Spirosoma sordidisoli]
MTDAVTMAGMGGKKQEDTGFMVSSSLERSGLRLEYPPAVADEMAIQLTHEVVRHSQSTRFGIHARPLLPDSGGGQAICFLTPFYLLLIV